jgi:hypothetical protein
MPSYDLSTAAFAVGASKKWLDNLTAQHDVTGIDRKRRGVAREFSFEGVLSVWLIRSLSADLSVSAWRAAEIAAEIQGSPNGAVVLASGITVSVDLESAARDVQQRLLEAAESVPRVRRGRPLRRRDQTSEF